MGYYIQTPGSDHDKARIIATRHNGKLIAQPESFNDIPADKALICIVDNGAFEAAALAYDADEFAVFTDPEDERPKQFVLLDKAACV